MWYQIDLAPGLNTIIYFQAYISYRKNRKTHQLDPPEEEHSSTMSALDLPEEVTVMMKKLRLVDLLRLYTVPDLLRLYSARSEFAELCYEKSLVKSTENITLNQLYKLYSEAMTENQRNQCFPEQVMDRLEINTFNEVVALYLKLENKDIFSNNKILETFENQIIQIINPELQDAHHKSEFWSY